MDTVAAYHFGWIDAEGNPADGDGGKAVRPALALLSAQAAGRAPEVGVPGAVAHRKRSAPMRLAASITPCSIGPPSG